MEDYHDEYGIKCALRHTIGDIRESRDFLELRGGDKYNTFLEAFEQCAKSGADMLSVESMGGKEIFDYAILRNDMAGILFGSALSDSFQNDLLSPPVYTRPREFRGLHVPEILLSGHQENIDKWKLEQAIERTKKRRPDLLAD